MHSVQMRQRAVSMCGSAYRSLSCEAAMRLLFMSAGGTDHLFALLKACSERGILSAQRALSAAQMADASGPQMLIFHA